VYFWFIFVSALRRLKIVLWFEMMPSWFFKQRFIATSKQRDFLFKIIAGLLFLITAFFIPARAQSADLTVVQVDTGDVIDEVVPVVAALSAPLYTLELTLSDDLLTVEGKADVGVTNTSDDVWNELVFRLYPNALGSTMTVADVFVADVEVKTQLDVEDTVLRVPVTLEPDERVQVSLVYTLEISPEVRSYGRLAKYRDALSLSHAYPTLSVYKDGAWLEDYPDEQGDPLVAEASLFDVTIRAPADWQVITTGQTLEQITSDERQTLHIITGPARDFFVAAFRGYREVKKQVGETEVRVFAPQSLLRGARSTLEVAARALEFFSEHYTPYPYKEFDLVAIPVEAGGVEYPGIVVITNGLLVGSGNLTQVVVHEVAHQWSFALVGSDQLRSPWQDESLTQYLTLRYQQTFNPKFVEGYERYWRNLWDRADTELPVGLPVAEFSESDYVGIIYGKGLFFFKALAAVVGQDALDKALRDYFETYAFQLATPEEFEAVIEASCACDITPVLEKWLE
jgi:aminopeptidase N